MDAWITIDYEIKKEGAEIQLWLKIIGVKDHH